jgi:hydroxyacylglutathione hydrolase
MSSGKTDQIGIEKFILGPLQTNCYLVCDRSTRESVVIDPGWRDRGLLDRIEEIKAEVKYIINTHGHADHTAGDSDFSVPVVIHRMDEGYLRDPFKNMSYFTGFPVRISSDVKLVEDGDLIKVGGVALEVLHTPGHTPGGISLKCEENVFTGDTLFFEGIGRTDLPGGDFDAILNSIGEKLMRFSDGVRVLPGHGPETTIGEARKFMTKEFSGEFRFSSPG